MNAPLAAPSSARPTNPANRFGLDYAAEAGSFPRLPYPIIDVHTHINGERAARLYKSAAAMYGIGLTYSMTHLEQAPKMREIFGDSIRFIAVPNWYGEDKRYHMGKGFIERIEAYHRLGCRIAKFWAAPRSVEIAQKMGDPTLMHLNSSFRIEAMQAAHDLGMIFMTHVADPDTWFATKYADAKVYGAKRDHYQRLEELLERFNQPWIAAHLGGSPEDLEFLSGLLERHSNLYIDTSAAKWMIRELSRHSRKALIDFLQKFRGRVMFGSDIVTMEDHLAPASNKMEMAAKANNESEAFDLYASRYWALRKMWETDYRGESPIADPDLHMVDPARYIETDAPQMTGRALPTDLLRTLYHDSAEALLEPMHRR